MRAGSPPTGLWGVDRRAERSRDAGPSQSMTRSTPSGSISTDPWRSGRSSHTLNPPARSVATARRSRSTSPRPPARTHRNGGICLKTFIRSSVRTLNGPPRPSLAATSLECTRGNTDRSRPSCPRSLRRRPPPGQRGAQPRTQHGTTRGSEAAFPARYRRTGLTRAAVIRADGAAADRRWSTRVAGVICAAVPVRKSSSAR